MLELEHAAMMRVAAIVFLISLAAAVAAGLFTLGLLVLAEPVP